MIFENIDVIVIGGGHAGCEAAAAAARLGSKTLLISMDLTAFGKMSCNPSIGGIAKGQIVREVDALGGFSGIVADKSMIQFRMLNRSKGPAMWSPRSQNDRTLFSIEWRKILEGIPNLLLWRDEVVDILLEEKKVIGVKTRLQLEIMAKSVVITSGTFLDGKIHIGTVNTLGGRIGEMPANGLSGRLRDLGINVARLKTGTPVRVDGRSINFDKMSEQPGDENPGKFSYTDTPYLTHQRSCFITYTNEEVHTVLRKGFEYSPLFKGIIQGVGPRYCPSIEDKLVRFSDKNAHQLFVEPDGWDTEEYYINGFSSSLPLEIQFEALRKISGMEEAVIMQPGYAIEYDYFPPTQLKNTLESKQITNLYFAGQVNGTTGYEEAAGQGIIAGINAHLKVAGDLPFVLSRSEAYIGVLIDDLITKGVDEPYRMFTSRAEYRLLLRQDNADIRLTEKAYNIGLADADRMKRVEKKQEFIQQGFKYLESKSINPDRANDYLNSKNSSTINQKVKIGSLLLRPELFLVDLQVLDDDFSAKIFDVSQEFRDTLEIEYKYQSYLLREKENAERSKTFEEKIIPDDINYNKVVNITIEARQKLSKIRPSTIGMATRISGISPADIAVLLAYLQK